MKTNLITLITRIDLNLELLNALLELRLFNRTEILDSQVSYLIATLQRVATPFHEPSCYLPSLRISFLYQLTSRTGSVEKSYFKVNLHILNSS
jgi:hypothetical protein